MILNNGKVLVEEDIRNIAVICNENIITDIVEGNYKANYQDEEYIDCSGLYVFPGFIDCHIHGGGGGDSCRQTLESYIKIVKNEIIHGTTSIVLAIGGMTDDFVHKSIGLIQEVNIKKEGANILGLHLEGPWINPKKKGAIPQDNLAQNGNVKRVETLISGYESMIKIITLAPELEGIDNVIKLLVSKGIIVSLGHSAASIEEANRAIKNGAKSFTHLFNASTPISGRDPGLVGSALCNDDCYSEIIIDGQHVHQSNVKLVAKIMADRLVAVTDAIEVTGTNKTEFELPGVGKVLVHDGRTWGPNDSIIGSVLTLDQAMKNLVKWNVTDLVHSVHMMTKNPAELLGIYPLKGCITKGSAADFTIMDSEFNVVYTIVGGKILYRKG